MVKVVIHKKERNANKTKAVYHKSEGDVQLNDSLRREATCEYCPIYSGRTISSKVITVHICHIEAGGGLELRPTLHLLSECFSLRLKLFY